jgi:hypothetical protein
MSATGSAAARKVAAMNDNPLSAKLTRLAGVALVVGVIALSVAAVPAFFASASSEGVGYDSARAQFFRSYLVAFLVLLAPALGSLGMLMIHHLSGGVWGAVLRPVLEPTSRMLLLLAVLFVPLLFGLHDLYPWARWTADEIHGSAVLETKAMYLNVPAFVIRAAVYWVVWLGLVLLLTGSNGRDEAREARRSRVSAVGLLLYSVAVTFASIDWVMSLEPMWYSTIFGLLFGAGQVLAGFAFGILCLVLIVRASGAELPRGPMQDLGSLLLALVMVWAYMAFSQFLLIWSGNLPEETPWYIKRLHGGWQVLALMLVLAQFVLPFLLLLSRDLKRDARALAGVAAVVLLMRVVDLYWMVTPAFFPHQAFRLHWMDLAALVGVAGVWLAVFLYGLRGRNVLPDPALAEVTHG